MDRDDNGLWRSGLAGMMALCLALACSPGAWASLRCLNTDAAAQTRLLAYDAGEDLRGDQAEPITDHAASSYRSEANDRTAKTPYQVSKTRLLDWTAWPVAKIQLAGKTFEFMGIHVIDKSETGRPPCIRLLFRLLAPAYVEPAGIGYLRSDYEKANPLLVRLAEAASQLVVYDHSQKFYVVNLSLLRANKYWNKRYDLYKRNVSASRNPDASYPVYFERFLLNVIRLARYATPRMSDEERRGFVKSTYASLKSHGGIDCQADPTQVACILNSIFMETELGAAHPLSVSDALDNSGLAFGPRQLDLGQGRSDAARFARQHLVVAKEEYDAKWDRRFLRPLEEMTRSDLALLYDEVIPVFNERLGLAGDDVVTLYVDGLLAMAKDDYGLNRVAFSGKGRLLAQLIAADFNNKWAGRTVQISQALAGKGPYDECAFAKAWRDQVKARLAPADLEDFRRRGNTVIRYFEQSAKVKTHCEI